MTRDPDAFLARHIGPDDAATADMLRTVGAPSLDALIDGLELFGLGASWGGFESLVMPTDVRRTATRWDPPGPVFRVHAGLEAIDDLIADMDQAFGRLRKVIAGG